MIMPEWMTIVSVTASFSSKYPPKGQRPVLNVSLQTALHWIQKRQIKSVYGGVLY
jgi:hypothetical protein